MNNEAIQKSNDLAEEVIHIASSDEVLSARPISMSYQIHVDKLQLSQASERKIQAIYHQVLMNVQLWINVLMAYNPVTTSVLSRAVYPPVEKNDAFLEKG